MEIVKIVLSSLLLLTVGLFLIVLGLLAIISPQKIANYYLNRLKKLTYFKRLQQYQIAKAEQGMYIRNWNSSGPILILMGLIFLWALISYWQKI